MRNFLQISHSVETLPMLNALAARPELWNQNPLRTQYPGTPHREADDIWVFFNAPEQPEAVINDIQTDPYPAWDALPVKDIVLNLMRFAGATQVGRVVISRLAPGKQIYPHVDQGAPAEFYQRYQIMLQCLPGVIFSSGDEVVQMKTGDVFWFNNREEHAVINNSADDRISLIVDLRIC